MVRSFSFAFLAVFLLGSYSVCAGESLIAPSADATQPIAKGATMPDAAVHDSEGNETSLKKLTEGKPTVLVFFRGGWCPICTRHTGQLIQAYPQIKAKGAQVVAISPDNPKNTEANQTKNSIPFPVYSDSDLAAVKAFGLAFQVDDATLEKYKGYGINLKAASGRAHQSLPIPAVYIVDANGKVIYAHSDANYRERLDPELILKNLP